MHLETRNFESVAIGPYMCHKISSLELRSRTVVKSMWPLSKLLIIAALDSNIDFQGLLENKNTFCLHFPTVKAVFDRSEESGRFG